MACTLTLTILQALPPTSAGGWGLVTYRISGTVDTSQVADVYTKDGSYFVNVANLSAGDGEYQMTIPPVYVGSELVLRVREDSVFLATTCKAEAAFTAPGYVDLVDPSLADAPRWEPVGGVLPNPVLLKVEATLLTTGVARPGLHVEVALWRPAAAVAFATFRATVREAIQYVDAAPYLRAELVALQRYAATSSSPLIDADASLRFYYKYRVIDRTGAEPWQTRAGERYAVLAALPGAADTMAPYVADTTGKVASIFDDYEATQFVGLPLEASVLLPPSDQVRYAELRYLDAYKQPVEIRAYALASDLPAGMLRIPLPSDPPVCASFVEVSVVDTDRSFPGTCAHVVPTPPASTSGTYADPIYGLYGNN
jgi:hypothetical protein